MFKIAFKDLKLFFADKRGVLLTFLLPISLITLFSLAFGGSGSSDESRPQTLVVTDEDGTDFSQSVIAKLDSLKEIEVRLTTLDTAQRWVKKGNENAVLIFHKGFKESVEAGTEGAIELQYDAAKAMEIGILQSALIGNLMSIIGPGSMKTKIVSRFDAQYPDMDSTTRANIHQQITENLSGSAQTGGSDGQGSMITTTALVREKENSPGLVQAVAGTAIMMLLFSVTGLGASMLDEKQEGTLKKLLYSPLHPNSILFGKMISTNIISMMQMIVMFLFSGIVFGLDIGHNIPSLLLMVFATAFACSGFGVLLAAFAKSRSQVQGVSTLIILSMSAFGGSMIPVFLMPAWMQQVAVVSVNYWGIQGFYDIYWRMLAFTDPVFLSKVGVLLGMGLVLNLVALRMFKKNVLDIS